MTVAFRHDPLRILFVSGIPLGGAACRYRCEHIAEALRKSGAQVDVIYIGQPRVRVAHDIVVLYRVCATAEGCRFAQAARSCGAALVYSTDDVVFDAPQAPPQMGSRFRALAPLHREMLRKADAAIASTEYLAQWMRIAAPETPVHTLRNFLSDDLVHLSDAARKSVIRTDDSDRVTLGYFSGSATHDEDLAAIAEPLSRVLAANPEAKLLIVGPVRLPEILSRKEAAGQVRHLPAVEWKTLPQLMIEQGVDTNLAPLELSREFSHAKSEVKFLEAAALGIPTVASPGKGFWETISGQNGESGCFAAVSPSEWETCLNFLIQQRQERTESGFRAHQQAQITGGAKVHTDTVRAVFNTLADLRRPVTRSDDKGTMVNWPFSTKYALKSAFERGARLRLRRGGM